MPRTDTSIEGLEAAYASALERAKAAEAKAVDDRRRWQQRTSEARQQTEALAEYLRGLRDQAADLQASIDKTLKLLRLQ